MLLFINNQMCFKGRGNKCQLSLSQKKFCSRCSIFACVCYDGHVHQWSSLWSAVCSMFITMITTSSSNNSLSAPHGGGSCSLLANIFVAQKLIFGSWGPLVTLLMYLPRVPYYMTVGEKFWDAAKWFPLFKWSKKCSVFEVCSVNMFLLNTIRQSLTVTYRLWNQTYTISMLGSIQAIIPL